MKRTKNPFLGSACTSSTSLADLRATPSRAATIRSFLTDNLLPALPKTALIVTVGKNLEKSAGDKKQSPAGGRGSPLPIAALTGDKLGDGLDFSLRWA
jgi:hypothetical protein